MGGLFGEIATGIAVDLGKDAAVGGAKSAAAVAGTVEHELDTVDGPRPAALWSPLDPHALEAAGLAKDQAVIVATLLRARDTELDRIVAELRSIDRKALVVPFWFAAGDSTVMRQFPELPGESGWTLDSILAWTDPAAAADATVAIGIDGIIQVPMRVTATRANPAQVKIGLPVGNTSGNNIHLTPAAGGGGSVADRVGLLLQFKRGA